jgi:outer membrane protein TolC
LNSNFQFRLSQHLLQGLGFASNTRFIRIAKNNRELSDVAFRLQTITTVDQIENMYWDLVYAYENLRVKEESLAFSEKTLSDTKKQVEIGSLAPIEAVRAQSTVAADQQALTVARTNLQLEQLIMKNALSRTLHDPTLANADVIPTSTMDVPENEQTQPTEELVNEALQHRAELIESRIQLNSQQISNQALRSSLLPTLDAYAYYGGYGLGGSQNPTNLCGDPLNPGIGCTTIPASPISYGGTLNQLVNSTASDKGVGLHPNIRCETGRPSRCRFVQWSIARHRMALQQTENR